MSQKNDRFDRMHIRSQDRKVRFEGNTRGRYHDDHSEELSGHNEIHHDRSAAAALTNARQVNPIYRNLIERHPKYLKTSSRCEPLLGLLECSGSFSVEEVSQYSSRKISVIYTQADDKH